MFGERSTRTLLGPADPARVAAAVPAPPPARELIGRAGADAPVAPAHRQPPRRLVLAAGLTAVAAGATALALVTGSTPGTVPPGRGPSTMDASVLRPIAYQIPTGAPAAGPYLVALADRLVDAPYDGRTGGYTYHETRVWGDPTMVDPSGRYALSWSSRTEVWQGAGSSRQVTTQLGVQYPDQASRDYWTAHPEMTRPRERKGGPGGHAGPFPVITEDTRPPMPTTRAGLAAFLHTGDSAAAMRGTYWFYNRYAVPRATRAEILRVLATVPGLRWRGEVTDRAGRAGVAVTYDDGAHDEESLLVFDPRTGELLAHEMVVLKPIHLTSYTVFLDTDVTEGFPR
jgi:hypothetical protein